MGPHYKQTIAWQKAMAAAVEVYRLVALLPKEEIYGMRSQITRAAVSIAANIAEGWSRESAREKGQFLAIAQGSLAETETLISLCEPIVWFPREQTQKVHELLEEVSRILTALRRRFRR